MVKVVKTFAVNGSIHRVYGSRCGYKTADVGFEPEDGSRTKFSVVATPAPKTAPSIDRWMLVRPRSYRTAVLPDQQRQLPRVACFAPRLFVVLPPEINHRII